MKTAVDPIVEKFRPLTYYEVKTGKRYRARIGRTKWVYEVRPLSAVAVVRVFELKQAIMEPMNRAATEASKTNGFSGASVELVKGFLAIATVLWEIGIKPSGIIKRIRMRMAFFKYALDDTEWLMRIWYHVLSANSRVAFFFETPGELTADSGKALAGDGFFTITRGQGDPNSTPWLEYIYLHEADKIKTINQWEANKRATARHKRNHRIK